MKELYRKITVEEALYMENSVFIDVRSPVEFEEGSIPNAKNIPILNDDERAIVGTLYKQENQHEAKIQGIQFASYKLQNIYDEINQLIKEQKNVIVFCWRGGLRSGSVCSFLSSLGINVYQLEGGYKKYRKYVMDYFAEGKFKHKCIVLHGYTGVGKTEILEKLEALNIPILNLEKLVRNSGSVFGHFAYKGTKPVKQKEFEANAFEILRKSNSEYIVVESEGHRLGSVTFPQGLYNAIIRGYQVLINTSIEIRVERLVHDYVTNTEGNDEFLANAITGLTKRIGTEKVNQHIDWIKEKSYDKIARELIIEYYDPLYLHSINKYEYSMEINYDDINEVVHKIAHLYHCLEKKS